MNFADFFSDIKCDLWHRLEHAEKPIVLYGMGDGADKIINVLHEKNIEISGVFASDGFVRDKNFHSFKVQKYSDLKEKFPNMIILMSFGTNLDEVIENVKFLMSEQEFYLPDVPVFGDTLFDYNYFLSNISKFEKVYEKLSDEKSKEVYVSSIKYKLSGKVEYLFSCQTDIKESFDNIFKIDFPCRYVDIGAYNGDTINQFLYFTNNRITKITAFEPDIKNFAKLLKNTEKIQNCSIDCYNAAAYDKDGTLFFNSRSGRNSSIESNALHNKSVETKAVRADNILKNEKVGIIKIDAEGSDKKALLGLENTIKRCAPCICVAAYHRSEDYFDIPFTVLDLHSEYNVYFRHFKYIPSWDTNFYFVKK